MKPYETWPLILAAPDIIECIGCSRGDAQSILKNGPAIDPKKKRCKTITKRALIEFLEGERA